MVFAKHKEDEHAVMHQEQDDDNADASTRTRGIRMMPTIGNTISAKYSSLTTTGEEEDEEADFDDDNVHGEDEEAVVMRTRIGRSLNDDEDSSSLSGFDTTSQAITVLWRRPMERFLLGNWSSDDWYQIRGVEWLEGPASVKFIKFLWVTLFFLYITFHIVRSQPKWEYDATYGLHEMMLYDMPTMILDMMVFFIVGRLYRNPAVDTVLFVSVTLAASIYASSSTTISFLHHSVSLYEIACVWPWQLWMYLLCLIPVIVVLIVRHVHYAIATKSVVRKLVEIGVSLVFFLNPSQLSHPNFHFHHWFAGMIVGMHANEPTWWSRLVQAWCWGLYINGIAVWGRDPMLTCAYGYYTSINQYCPYMGCFTQQVQDIQNVTNATSTVIEYKPLPEPDWRNCSAQDNYVP